MANVPQISDAEWQIMKILWKNSPLKAIDIINSLDNKTRWQPKTVKTLIRRLVEKKAISYNEDGKYYLYYPIVEEKECIKVENSSFINRVYNGSLNLMFSSFLKSEKLNESEINELKAILDKSLKESEE